MINDKTILSVLTIKPQSTNSIAKKLNISDSSIMSKFRNINFKSFYNIIEESRIFNGRNEITFRTCNSFIDEFEKLSDIKDKIKFIKQNPQSIEELFMENKLLLV